MLTEYFEAAMAKAVYDQMADGRWWGEIPGLTGLWAVGRTPAEAAEELRSALEDWVALGLAENQPLPVLDGIDLNAKDVA